MKKILEEIENKMSELYGSSTDFATGRKSALVEMRAFIESMQRTEMVDAFLQAMRESDFYIKFIYTEGGCFQLYKILKVLFPDAEPYMLGNGTHVATMIGGKLWDIYGEVKDGDGDFCKMTEAQMQDAEKWSFAANNDLYLGECPICGHPITIDRAKLINKG